MVFPQPLRPTRPMRSPWSTVQEMSRKMSCDPYALETRSIWIKGMSVEKMSRLGIQVNMGWKTGLGRRKKAELPRRAIVTARSSESDWTDVRRLGLV